MPDTPTQLYEVGYTITVQGESKDNVLRIITEEQREQYVAYAKDATYAEANVPNVRGILPSNPTPTVWWVRPVSQEQQDDKM